MTHYEVRLQTCKQYLVGKYTVLHIDAENGEAVEEKVSAICDLIESDMDKLSVYRIHSYTIVAS